MPHERLALQDVRIGHTLSGVACVRVKQLGQTRAGDPYLTIGLATRSGAITGKVWKEQIHQWEQIEIGSPVLVSGTVKAGYRGGPPEFDCASVSLLPTPHPVQLELNPVCPIPLPELEARYTALLEQASMATQELVTVVIDSVGRDDFWTAPAAKQMHHAYIHGLAEHSIEVAEFALRLAEADAYGAFLDRDAIIAGALLHDLAKVREYVWCGAPIDISPFGRLRHHTSVGPELVSLAVTVHAERLKAAGVRVADVEHVQHVQESHHGKPEWGSAVEPATAEAVIIHHADMVSARMRGVVDDLLSAPPDGAGWVVPSGWKRRPILTRRPAALHAARAARSAGSSHHR